MIEQRWMWTNPGEIVGPAVTNIQPWAHVKTKAVRVNVHKEN